MSPSLAGEMAMWTRRRTPTATAIGAGRLSAPKLCYSPPVAVADRTTVGRRHYFGFAAKVTVARVQWQTSRFFNSLSHVTASIEPRQYDTDGDLSES